MARARLILMCGLPGSGKTTLAKRLAKEARAVRLSPDEWKQALGLDYYDEPGRVRLEARLWMLAHELLGLGQSVILENGFWAREEREELLLAARSLGVAVELHYLDAPVDELWRRLALRNASAEPGVCRSCAAISRSGLRSSKRRIQPKSLCTTAPPAADRGSENGASAGASALGRSRRPRARPWGTSSRERAATVLIVLWLRAAEDALGRQHDQYEAPPGTRPAAPGGPASSGAVGGRAVS